MKRTMSATTQKQQGHFRRNWIFYTLLTIALSFSGYLWISKSMALNKQANSFKAEKTAIIEQAKIAFDTNSERHLELMMKTFVWAVRGEMTRGNQEQVDQYFKQLVKAEKVQEITLVDKVGKILISTNKKNEGSTIATKYANSILKIEEMTIIEKGEKQVVAAPVLSLDSRIGTLMVIYKSDIFKIEEKVDLVNN